VVTLALLAAPTDRPVAETTTASSTVTLVSNAEAARRGSRTAARRSAAGAGEVVLAGPEALVPAVGDTASADRVGATDVAGLPADDPQAAAARDRRRRAPPKRSPPRDACP
jgi:hypothetical protein